MPATSLSAYHLHCVLAIAAALGSLRCAEEHAASPVTDARAVQQALDVLTDADGAPGALIQVRARRGDSVTLTAGTSELGRAAPMIGAEGQFRVGSLTKPFVALAVLQLVADGEVALDRSIEVYLPGVVRGTADGASIDGRQITVRQLLQHTSGIPDYVRYFTAIPQEPVAPGDLVAFALEHAPDFEPPGSSWSYSNTGYLILGLLLERVTGKDIASVLVERIMQPLGLTQTYWPPAGERAIRGPHARNYTPRPGDPAGELVDVTDLEPSVAWAAGQLISTPTDLNRFWEALFDEGVLSDSLLREMTDALVLSDDFDPGAGYGLGLFRRSLSCGGFYWGHSGDHLGVQAESGRDDDDGRQVTVYITRRQGERTSEHIEQAVDVALCSGRMVGGQTVSSPPR
jgi:D-alanyl-D-alanine carboxypeptidase